MGPPKRPQTVRASTTSDKAALEEQKQRQRQKEQETEPEPEKYSAAGEPDPSRTSTEATGTTSIDLSRASVDLDDLPIELIGLADSFIESLQAKVYPTPPNIDTLARKFQEFYATASSHIATHIAALASRQNRDQSPAPPASRASAASLLRAKAAATIGNSSTSSNSSGSNSKSRDRKPSQTASAKTSGPGQQMLSGDELAERKRARRALEQKRGQLEEAVERRLCEGIYDRIYRHHTTQDEAQDEMLRSKTAALDVVGIGPADLGVDLGAVPAAAGPDAVAEKGRAVRAWLAAARADLVQMSETHYPLGKLNRLKAAHKHIVDTLAHFHPSSSADEIMPMLIYTLITLPPAQLQVVSDLQFIQRFRWEPKLEGEAAYCLTNLEAAISFLETVDLSTLRADEAPSGPPRKATTAGSETPKGGDTFPPAYSSTHQQGGLVPFPTIATTTTAPTTPTTPTAILGVKPSSPSPSPTAATTNLRVAAAAQLRNRRLSDLVNTPAQALSSASDAVMNTFNAADQGLKTIGNSLEGSYRLLLGRFQSGEGAAAAAAAGHGGGTVRGGGAGAKLPAGGSGAGGGGATTTGESVVVLPKTLDEARKLVTTPPPTTASEDEASVNGDDASAQTTPPPPPPPPAPASLSLPQRPPHKWSFTTTNAGGNDSRAGRGGGGGGSGGRKPAASASRDHSADSTRSGASTRKVSGNASAGPAEDESANPALMDSVRNLGNSLNPMSRLSSIGGFRGFGRTVSTPAPTAATAVGSDKADKADGGVDLATAFPDLASALPPKPPLAPPIQRFLDMANPGDLRLSEVLELLRDYRRLAAALQDRGAFKAG